MVDINHHSHNLLLRIRSNPSRSNERKFGKPKQNSFKLKVLAFIAESLMYNQFAASFLNVLKVHVKDSECLNTT